MTNYYPKLPQLPFKKTTVLMDLVIKYLQSLAIDREVKRSCYVVFRNESANGNKGINNNYIGFQADSGRWDAAYDKYFTGTCIKAENGTNKQRIFLCFNRWQDSVDILADKLKARGMYVGGTTSKITKMAVVDKETLAAAYLKEWVKGQASYQPTNTEISNFVSMYNQAAKLFP